MKTVGNDIIRHQLHENRKWYLLLGALLVIFGLVLLASLGMATLTVVTLFGVLMMIGGVLHLLAAFKIFDGSLRWLWALFSGLLTLITGIMILASADAPFWVLGLFLAVDILFQGVNYLSFAAAIKRLPPASY